MMEKEEKERKGFVRFLPIIALLLHYLLILNNAFEVAESQNDVSYLILAITVPVPFFLIPIFIAMIKLIKKKN